MPKNKAKVLMLLEADIGYGTWPCVWANPAEQKHDSALPSISSHKGRKRWQLSQRLAPNYGG